VINAGGPWINNINRILGIKIEKQIALIKGSHIVVPRLYSGDHAYFLQGKDNRIIFAIPYYGNTMIGTTDLKYDDDLDNIEISKNEITYLCNLTNEYFKKHIDEHEIINSWSGVRPLLNHPED